DDDFLISSRFRTRTGASDNQHLPLALDDALKQMSMFAGKGDHLRRLCLGYLVRVSPALGNSFIMNAEHQRYRAFTVRVEQLFDHVHDKFHRRVIVVQKSARAMSTAQRTPGRSSCLRLSRGKGAFSNGCYKAEYAKLSAQRALTNSMRPDH